MDNEKHAQVSQETPMWLRGPGHGIQPYLLFYLVVCVNMAAKTFLTEHKDNN